MTYIGLGCLCFLFFILYDLNQIHKNHRGIRPLFAVGLHYALLLLTITMSVTEFESDYQVTFPAVAVFFLAGRDTAMLLVYTLFFCRAFSGSLCGGLKKKICKTGYMHCADTRGVVPGRILSVSVFGAWQSRLSC